jgi:hypothetical protein
MLMNLTSWIFDRRVVEEFTDSVDKVQEQGKGEVRITCKLPSRRSFYFSATRSSRSSSSEMNIGKLQEAALSLNFAIERDILNLESNCF